MDRRIHRCRNRRHHQLRQVAGLRRWRHQLARRQLRLRRHRLGAQPDPGHLGRDHLWRRRRTRPPGVPLGRCDHLQPSRRHEAEPRLGDHREDLQQEDHHLERPGHRRAATPASRFRPTRSRPSCALDGSGTTANFTTYLSETQPSIWTYPVSTAWPVTGESAQQGGSGVVSTVAAGKDTIGYADQSSVGTATQASIQQGTSGTTFVQVLGRRRDQGVRCGRDHRAERHHG